MQLDADLTVAQYRETMPCDHYMKTCWRRGQHELDDASSTEPSRWRGRYRRWHTAAVSLATIVRTVRSDNGFATTRQPGGESRPYAWESALEKRRSAWVAQRTIVRDALRAGCTFRSAAQRAGVPIFVAKHMLRDSPFRVVKSRQALEEIFSEVA